ncbi:LOW QUALITY PROTEIN: jouberin-like [Haliotis rubra]|uniref:LOW QUALITY PROTEIN: jouberin-like n=1 Tax=Haliotis rubra TaxID=36100 RepID=UPI001EE60C4F|nr:LOW QUALITY PROTEIN: jouberin-like [Haliotis rubra]
MDERTDGQIFTCVSRLTVTRFTTEISSFFEIMQLTVHPPNKTFKTSNLAVSTSLRRNSEAHYEDTARQQQHLGRFKRVLMDAIDAKKKKKKKSKGSERDDMLELLRKGEGTGLHKDRDEAIDANTFDPDNSKSEKSNKRRQRQQEMENNESDKVKKDGKTKKKIPKAPDTIEMIDETKESKPVKKKKKKKVEVPEEEVPEEIPSPTETTPKKKKKVKKSPVPEESTETPPVPEEEQTETTALVSPKDEKKKKKKKKPPDAEEDPEATTVKAEDETGTAEEPPTDETSPRAETPKKKKKKKKKEEEEVVTAAEEEVAAPDVKDVEDRGQILGLTIHRTDKLKNDFHILHPMIRVHMVDESTGTYLKKQKESRAVTSFYETKSDKVDHILPIMTQPFDFKQRKSTLPVWEELLVFNENYNYIIQKDLKIILFFELLDFVSMNTASRKYNNEKQEGGWHRIAWGFLKIHGANEKLNVGSKVRLQLFQPPNRFTVKPNKIELYQWWYSLPRVAYPSTLYITLKGITPPDEVEPAARSMFATQEERGRMTYDDLKKSMNWSSKTKLEERRPMTSWSRLFGQMCRIPNNLMLSLPAGRKGCYVLKFSHDGRNLACACQDKEGYPIYVYEIPSGTLRGEFSGHFGIIYDLCWSKKDTHLLSAASDGTARIWDLMNFGGSSDKLLPHPAFVYAAQFHPRVDNIVVTGGYDQVLRVWDVLGDEPHGQLMQEIENHHGHINSICFDEEGQKMYSADSSGAVFIWNVYVTEQESRRAFIREWTIFLEIRDPELKNVAINSIRMHPSGRRLLLHCRDNILRMLDLRVQRIMQNYIGALNFREKIRSAISPCGTFVFAGSEDNTAYVWNTETGDQVARYSELNYQRPVTDLDYHPRDHILAICSLGDNQPVLVYNYDPQVAHIGMGLSFPSKEPDDTTDVEDINTSRTTGRKSPVQTDDQLNSARSQVFSKGEFEAHEKSRYSRVMRKLDSATLQMAAQGPLFQMPESHPFGASPGSTSIWDGINTDDQLNSARSQVFSKGEFEAHENRGTVGLSRKLDSATLQMAAQGPLFQMPESHPFGASPGLPPSGMGSMFEQSYGLTPRASVLPSTFSPHAPQSMSTMMQHQQYSNQNLYLRQTDGWRPTFSEVGQRGGSRSSSPTFYGRPHQLSLSASQGKASFSFQSAPGKMGLQHRVVVMYDYRAQRSDELTIYKGDMIVVLYKDSENWWMGELPDGSQGYFPANYVISEDAYEGEELEEVTGRKKERNGKKKEVTAVKTRDGDLRFFSATDDSDTENTPKQSKLRSSMTGDSDTGSDSKPRKARRRVHMDESVA